MRPRKPQDHDDYRDIRLPGEVVRRLEELTNEMGKQTIAEVAVEAVEVYAKLRVPCDTAYERLSPRNRDVLRLVAEGMSTKGIAAQLKISVKTAEFHRSQLMKKLGIRGIAGLVRYAIRAGVILP